MQCQEAQASYGGRNYVAYFTTTMPFKGGPWKFQGLPGFILEVYSLDDEITFKATAISTLASQSEIVNPFQKDKTYSWENYLSLYKTQYEKYKIQMKMPNLKLTCGSNIEKFTL